MALISNGLAVNSALPISEANVTNLTTDLATLTTAANTLRVATTNVTSAQLLALNATPKQLLAAPGGRNFYAIVQMSFHYRVVTTPYNENVRFTLRVAYGAVGGTGDILVPLASSTNGDLFKSVADTYVIPPVCVSTDTLSSAQFASSVCENAAVILGLSSGSLTGGDGTLTVTTWYAIVNGA